MSSHAAFANEGNTAGQPSTPAKRAKLVMPIMGEISTIRSGARARGLSIERVLQRQRAAVRIADECSGWRPGEQRAWRTASRVAASQSPAHLRESGRDGAVPGHADATATKPRSR